MCAHATFWENQNKRKPSIEFMHKCPANNDQFTTYVNERWNIAIDAPTSQIELS